MMCFILKNSAQLSVIYVTTMPQVLGKTFDMEKFRSPITPEDVNVASEAVTSILDSVMNGYNTN